MNSETGNGIISFSMIRNMSTDTSISFVYANFSGFGDNQCEGYLCLGNNNLLLRYLFYSANKL